MISSRHLSAARASLAPRFFTVLALLAALLSRSLGAAEIPKIGETAPAFALKGLDDETVRLADLTAKGPVVLVVLRGWPGYQCPVCDRQVQNFIASAAEFAAAGAQLVFVYPGPAADLKAHAAEFKSWKGRAWPAAFRYALDPDYAFTNSYGLRWDAPRETAYPSTFILEKTGIVRFTKVSRSHGDRSTAAALLAELKKISAP
jgi:peroxiredoxin